MNEKLWPENNEVKWLIEAFPFPQNLSEVYEYECKRCFSKKVYIWTQESKTQPEHLCHLLICVDCGLHCCFIAMNKIIDVKK